MNVNIRKRILLNEVRELEEYYRKIQINIETTPRIIIQGVTETNHIIPRKTDIIDITLCDPIGKLFPGTVRFILENYPFRAPVVHVNNKPYMIPCSEIPKITTKFHAYNIPQGCLHCNFIIKKWSPVMSMEDILIQIEKFQYIKCNIKYEFAIDRLPNKLPQEIKDIIFSFLFEERT